MFITQFEHILEASWDQFNQHSVKVPYVKARRIPKDGNSHQSTLAWGWVMIQRTKKGRFFSGSHTELEQVIR